MEEVASAAVAAQAGDSPLPFREFVWRPGRPRPVRHFRGILCYGGVGF